MELGVYSVFKVWKQMLGPSWLVTFLALLRNLGPSPGPLGAHPHRCHIRLLLGSLGAVSGPSFAAWDALAFGAATLVANYPVVSEH